MAKSEFFINMVPEMVLKPIKMNIDLKLALLQKMIMPQKLKKNKKKNPYKSTVSEKIPGASKHKMIQ